MKEQFFSFFSFQKFTLSSLYLSYTGPNFTSLIATDPDARDLHTHTNSPKPSRQNKERRDGFGLSGNRTPDMLTEKCSNRGSNPRLRWFKPWAFGLVMVLRDGSMRKDEKRWEKMRILDSILEVFWEGSWDVLREIEGGSERDSTAVMSPRGTEAFWVGTESNTQLYFSPSRALSFSVLLNLNYRLA